MATTIPQRVKDRAEVVWLSHKGMYVEKIAAFFNWNERTVQEALHRWQPEDMEYPEACLQEDPHT